MIKPSVLAGLCCDIYEGKPFAQQWEKGNVHVGLAKIEDADIVVLRGTQEPEDWLLDLSFIPVWHPRLGFCHGGFLAGMDDVFAEVSPVVGKSLVITGHSLGGARARILAGMFAVEGIQVSQLTVFGSPRPAFINLARVIQKSGMIHTSYRNRRDVVPTVPLEIPPFLDFHHTEDWIAVDAAPEHDDLEPLRDHSCTLYAQATKALEG